MRTGLKRGGPAALLAALLLVSCGGDSDQESKKARPVGEMLVGSVAPMAQCRDWEGGTRAERLATIDDIREQVNLKDSAVQTPELSDKAAYRILDTICSRPYASTLRLYKLYARADSFAPFAED
ncbi:MAG: hypothetical protein JW895_13900 [Thermoleophilaceae bacterium]|nr:hypothetical protein [Thermoleophilaceae bacterium]